MTSLLLAGATGLVGGHALTIALADPRIDRIVAPTRRALPPHPKRRNQFVAPATLPPGADWWPVDAAICALGSTRAKARTAPACTTMPCAAPVGAKASTVSLPPVATILSSAASPATAASSSVRLGPGAAEQQRIGAAIARERVARGQIRDVEDETVGTADAREAVVLPRMPRERRDIVRPPRIVIGAITDKIWGSAI